MKKKLSYNALRWIHILHAISATVWAALILLVVWFGIAKIPMIIMLIVMNALYIIMACNE